MLFRNKIILLLLAVLCLGADDPRLISYPPEKIMGYRGLDSTSTAPTIQDARASDLLNVKISSAYDLRKRYGYDTVNDQTLDDADITSPAITGIFDSSFSNGNSWTLAFIGYKLKYDNVGTWQRVPGGGTITSSQNHLWKCVMALDNAVCTDNQDPPIQVDSTPSMAPMGFGSLSVTKVKDLIFYRNYMILGNTVESGTAFPTRFRWSDVGTINTWTSANFVNISTFAGDEIVGFAELYGDLYIFLTNSIWKASLVGGNDTFIFNKIVDGLGAIARDSIRVIQFPDNKQAVAFLEQNRRVLLFNGVSVSNIGYYIQPTLNGLSEARLQYATATFDGKDYFLSATLSGGSSNDLLLDYQVEINEWTKHDNINANALAQVKESTSKIKTYFGNYKGGVYWLDNPDLVNDVDGATGTIDSLGTFDVTNVITGGVMLIDSDMTAGAYTGGTVRITSGAGVGLEKVVLFNTTTGIVVDSAFSTTPTSSSVYSIGDINAYYETKFYDMGSAAREKAFLGMLLWAEENSGDEVTIDYKEDFGSTLGSETKSLEPAGNSLWDVALWDVGTWGTTGDKIYTSKFSGLGNTIAVRFSNTSIDESFHLYGFNLLATGGDIKQ